MFKNKMLILLILLVAIGFSLNGQTELLQNGDFSSGTQNWSLGQYEGSSASASVVNGEYQLVVTLPGSAIWNVQLTQNALNLEQGKTYILSFDTYRGPEYSGDMILNVNVSMAYSPWSSYFGVQDNSITLQTDKTHYTYQFTMIEADEDNGRVEFNCGSSTGTVFIDNVSLVEAPEGSFLEVIPQTIDLGLIEVGDNALANILIQNNSSGDILINSIESSSSDFEVEQIFPLSLAVNEEIDVNISYSATSPGGFTEELVLNSDATVNPVLQVSVSGEVYIPGIALSRSELIFSAAIDEEDLQILTLTNRSTGNLSFSFSSDSQWATIEPESGSIPAGTSVECTIAAQESEVGEYYGTLLLAHTATNISSPVTIPMTLNVVPDYEPTSIYITDPESNIQFIRDIADFRANQRDDVNGGYFTHIDREGNPNGENIKALCGESRIAYTFVRAFMVTGDEAYLEKARHALKFLYDHGWNNGWYFVTDLEGNYINHWGHNDWWSFIQHYALLGISAMVEVTGGTIDWDDGAESDLTWLMRGVDSNFNNLWDSRPGFEGYFGHANTDWSNKWDKGFTPTVDGVTTHTLLMSMMYDDPVYDQRLVDLADNIMDYLVGNMDEAAVGFPEVFDADWNIDYSSNIMDVGHGYKTAWVLQRAYLMNPDHPEYLAGAQALMQDLWDNGGYDKQYGGPFAQMDWQTGEVTSDVKDFWMIEQGLTSGLISYYTASTQEQRNMYMQVADESMIFFMDHMVDPVYGEAYDKVSRDGSTIVNENKGGLFTAGYHSSEMSYYSMLYSAFYYHKSPVDLFYYYETEDYDRSYTLTPVPIEEGLLKVLVVTLDGVPYTDFNSDTRTLNLPAGVGGKFKVTFGFEPLVTHSILASAENGGSISPAGDVSVVENSDQVFVFSADSGYEIDDVRVDGVSLGPIANFQFTGVVSDHTIEVFFSEIPSYIITASAGLGGTINPQGPQLVYENGSAVFNFLPEKGFRVDEVLVDGLSLGAVNSYEFIGVTTDHTIEVIFESLPVYTIAASSGEGGYITPSGNVVVQEGDSAVFTIAADTGFLISDVLIDDQSVGAIESYQFIAVSSDHTIVAQFQEVPPVSYAINSGSSTMSQPFSADQFVTGGTIRSVTSVIDLTGVVAEMQAPEAVYQSERYGNSVYTFDGLNANSDYSVRLHFAELYWTAAGSRLFDVILNGELVLDDLDIFAETGATYKALVKDFVAVADSNGVINIEFITETDNATIEGIEIFPAIPNDPPVIVNEAAAEVNPVTDTSVALSVLADDDQGESSLVYSWIVSNDAPGDVSFSPNQTNGAKNTIASFSQSGSYELEVTISDSRGKSVTSLVIIEVEQEAQRLELTPSTLSCGVNETYQFSADLYDQFDQLISDVSFQWIAEGDSAVTSNGLFTAGPLAEIVTLSVSAGNISAQALVTIVDEPLVIYQINTGSNGAASPFSADQFGTGGSVYSVTNSIDLSAVSDSDPAPASVYQDERYGDSSYVIPGLESGETYLVRLHFAELYWTSTGSRVFDVLINGEKVLANFDVFAVTGAQYKALIEEFSATATSGGEITIDFVTITDNATIEGIEILK